MKRIDNQFWNELHTELKTGLEGPLKTHIDDQLEGRLWITLYTGLDSRDIGDVWNALSVIISNPPDDQ